MSSSRTGKSVMGGFINRTPAEPDEIPTSAPVASEESEPVHAPKVGKPTNAKEVKKPKASDTSMQDAPRVPLSTDIPAPLRAEIMKVIYYLVPRTTMREAAEEAWGLWLEQKIAERGEPFPEIPTGGKIPTGRPPKW